MNIDIWYVCIMLLAFIVLIHQFLSLVNTSRQHNVCYLGSYYSMEDLEQNPLNPLLFLQCCLLSYDLTAIPIYKLSKCMLPMGDNGEVIVIRRPQELIVAIRGSVWLGDLITDLNLWQSEGFHLGFRRYCQRLEELLFPILDKHYRYRPEVPVYFTGHSLGGVVAEWMVARLICKNRNYQGKLFSFGFAVPTYLKVPARTEQTCFQDACINYLHESDPAKRFPRYSHRIGKTELWNYNGDRNPHVALAYYETILKNKHTSQ
jgi:hypothetical protein